MEALVADVSRSPANFFSMAEFDPAIITILDNMAGEGYVLDVERESGIEPPCVAWKATVLPLNYSRKKVVGREGFAPS